MYILIFNKIVLNIRIGRASNDKIDDKIYYNMVYLHRLL